MVNPSESFNNFQYLYDVFISYSTQDEDWVRGELLQRLESSGLEVCIDFRDFRLGHSNIEEIKRAIRESRKILLVLTPQYISSEWAVFERQIVQNRAPLNQNARLIPVLKEQCELPEEINHLIYVNLTQPNSEAAWKRLLQALVLSKSKPPAKPQPLPPEPESSPPPKPKHHPLSSWVNIRSGIVLFFFVSFVGCLWWVSRPKLCSNGQPTVNGNCQSVSVLPLTLNDIESLQQQISVGDKILAVPEGEDATNKRAFKEAKQDGTTAIAEPDYQSAIEFLSSTRRGDNPAFYKNAPETLIYLNNAYIGDKPAYTIAVAAPISQWDSYGLVIFRGVALAQYKINTEEGGITNGVGQKIPLRVVVVDDKSTSNNKLALLLSSLSLDVSGRHKEFRILGLIGHQTSDLTLDLGEIYQQAEIPVISPSATSTKLLKKFSYVHSVPPTTLQMARRLAQEINNRQRVIIFYDSEEQFSNSFGTELCSTIGQAACELWNLRKKPVDTNPIRQEIDDGSTVLVIAFNPSKSDENKNKTSRIIKAISDFNQTSPSKMELFSGNAFYDKDLLDEAGTSGVTIVRVGPWDRDMAGNLLSPDVIQKNAQFLKYNKDVWGTDKVNWFTLMSYNATRALAKAIEASKSLPPNNEQELKAMRIKINEPFLSDKFSVTGALGNIDFTEGYVSEGNFVCVSRVISSSETSSTDCQPSR